MFSSEQWTIIQEACEQRSRQWEGQARNIALPSQRELCIQRISALNQIVAQIAGTECPAPEVGDLPHALSS